MPTHRPTGFALTAGPPTLTRVASDLIDLRPFGKVVVLGDGGWGTTLALVLHRSGRQVGLWSYDPAYAALLAADRNNPRYLPGFDLPDEIEISSDLSALLPNADLLISAVPTQFLREVWSAHARSLPGSIPIVTVSKGLEQDTLLRPSEILAEVTGQDRPIAVLSGPNIAREVAKGLPSATVIASNDPELSRRIQATISWDGMRVYSNPDRAGVELGGVLKNVIALAAGMCDGMELGANTKAMLVTRGVLEMARLGETFGGKRNTFFGLSGLGDLMTTCESKNSRNRTFGERIGRGERVADIAASMQQVAEGVKSAKPVHDLMEQHNLSLPISHEVYQVVHEGKDPVESVRSLMRREQKDEAEDLAW